MDPTYQGLPPSYPTTRQQSRGLSMRFLFLIVAGIAVVIVAIVLLLNSRDQTGPLQMRLMARLDTVQRMIKEGDENLKDPDLRKINSDIYIQVLSDTSTINSALTKAGTKKPDKTMAAAESDQSSFKSLSDAALNNHFDSTYEKTLAQKFDSTSALIREIYDKSSNKQVRAALGQAYEHFKHLETQLSSPATSS